MQQHKGNNIYTRLMNYRRMCWTYIVASPTVMSSPRSMTAEGVYRLYAPRTATALPSQDILHYTIASSPETDIRTALQNNRSSHTVNKLFRRTLNFCQPSSRLTHTAHLVIPFLVKITVIQNYEGFTNTFFKWVPSTFYLPGSSRLWPILGTVICSGVNR